MQVQTCSLRPFQDGLDGKLGPIVRNNSVGAAPSRHSSRKSRTTRAPDNDVSAIKATFSRGKSSTTVRMRNPLPSVNASDTKSGFQRWFAVSGTPIGLHVPKARFQSALRRTCSFSVPARRRSALTIRYHRLEAFDAWNAVVNAD